MNRVYKVEATSRRLGGKRLLYRVDYLEGKNEIAVSVRAIALYAELGCQVRGMRVTPTRRKCKKR